jgi:hypothetical protein
MSFLISYLEGIKKKYCLTARAAGTISGRNGTFGASEDAFWGGSGRVEIGGFGMFA